MKLTEKEINAIETMKKAYNGIEQWQITAYTAFLKEESIHALVELNPAFVEWCCYSAMGSWHIIHHLQEREKNATTN